MVAIMHVFVLPPRESLSSLVNLLSLQREGEAGQTFVFHCLLVESVNQEPTESDSTSTNISQKVSLSDSPNAPSKQIHCL